MATPTDDTPAPPAAGFYDFSAALQWLCAREIAKAIRRDPSVIETGREHLRRFPPHPDYEQLWVEALSLPPDALADALVADDERGVALRDSMPAFGVATDPDQRVRLINEARTLAGKPPLAEHVASALRARITAQAAELALPDAALINDTGGTDAESR